MCRRQVESSLPGGQGAGDSWCTLSWEESTVACGNQRRLRVGGRRDCTAIQVSMFQQLLASGTFLSYYFSLSNRLFFLLQCFNSPVPQIFHLSLPEGWFLQCQTLGLCPVIFYPSR